MDDIAGHDGLDRRIGRAGLSGRARNAGSDGADLPVGLQPEPGRAVEAPAAGPRVREIDRRRGQGGRRGRPCGVRDGDAVCPVVGWPDPIERVGACLAREDDRLADQPAQEAEVGHDPQHDRVVEGARQACEGRRTVRPPRDDLGEHRVEATTDLAPKLDPGIDPDARTVGPAQRFDPPGGRQEAVVRVLGVETDLDGVPSRPCIPSADAEWLTGRDAQLVRDEVASRHEFRDRVLHLQTGVHLEEGRLAAVVDEEFAGAGTHVVDRTGEHQRRVAQASPLLGIDAGRWRLLEQLLVSPLDRAVTFAELHAGPMGIEQDLDLDVASAFEEALEDEPVIAERAGSLTTGSGERVGESLGLAHRSHALAAATCRRLDQERVTDPGRGCRERLVRLICLVVAGECRDPERSRQPTRGSLVTHRPDGVRRRADPADPGHRDALGEIGVFGQESETRVEGVRAGSPGFLHDRSRIQQVQRFRTVGRWNDRADPEAPAGPRDAMRDLAAIGDEHRPDRGFGGRSGRAGRSGCTGMAGRTPGHERVQHVRRDTPSTTDTSRWQSAARDPALHGTRCRSDLRRGLARAQFFAHQCRDRRIYRLHTPAMRPPLEYETVTLR